MDTKEIMANEEVFEVTEEVVKSGSGRGFKVVAGVGLVVLTGVLVYKYVAKPIIVAAKAKKEQEFDEIVTETVDVDVESAESE